MDANARRIEEELLPFYALDALTDQERTEVDAYLAANPNARLKLAEYAQGVEALALSVAPVTPDPRTKDQLFSRIAAEGAQPAAAAPRAAPPARTPVTTTKPRRSWFSWPTAALAVSLVLIAALGWAVLSLRDQLRAQATQIAAVQAELDALAAANAQAESDLTTLTDENDRLREELLAREEQLAVYQAPGARTFAIGAIDDAAEGAVAIVTVAPDNGSAIVQTSNMPPLGEGLAYQLWYIADGVAHGAAVFEVDASGAATLTTGALPPGLQAIGVSREPAGGSDQPTPDQILLLGEVPG